MSRHRGKRKKCLTITTSAPTAQLPVLKPGISNTSNNNNIMTGGSTNNSVHHQEQHINNLRRMSAGMLDHGAASSTAAATSSRRNQVSRKDLFANSSGGLFSSSTSSCSSSSSSSAPSPEAMGTIAFGRRPDYSTFNILHPSKINSYHIRMEDETSHGNDNIRTLILSTLSSNGMDRVNCVVCSSSMPIFERFPLIDGTFFLSPRQHSKAAVQIVGASIERKYLNAVCMGCLEGWNSSLKCRFCRTKWDGSHLILGSMYSYDIFAAVPCCISRLMCCNCNHLAIAAGRRLEFFSDYSQNLACAHCGMKDFHFVKPLYITFMPSNAPGGHLVMNP